MRAKLLIFVFITNGFLAITSSSTCTKYGDPPAAITNSADGLLTALNVCNNITGNTQLLNFTDSNGQNRYACFLLTSSSKPLPLLVWIHPSLFPPSTIFLTNLVPQANTANLTGTVGGPLGYHLLLPFGRDTAHIYPAPDNQGLGWDNWYRNYNRSDPTLNVDVQTIDYFIYLVILNSPNAAHIDKSRVFMSGWSNGAAMAIEYALNTPGITAAAAYAAPDLYRDYEDPCAQVPYPSSFTPILILYNQCDIIGICTTGSAFIADLNNRYSNTLIARAVIIDILFNTVTTCAPECNGGSNLGTTQHNRWPVTLNDAVYFNFFRQFHQTPTQTFSPGGD